MNHGSGHSRPVIFFLIVIDGENAVGIFFTAEPQVATGRNLHVSILPVSSCRTSLSSTLLCAASCFLRSSGRVFSPAGPMDFCPLCCSDGASVEDQVFCPLLTSAPAASAALNGVWIANPPWQRTCPPTQCPRAEVPPPPSVPPRQF